jgi:hypothetical protein
MSGETTQIVRYRLFSEEFRDVLTDEKLRYYKSVGLRISREEINESRMYLTGYVDEVRDWPVAYFSADSYPKWLVYVENDRCGGNGFMYRNVSSTEYGNFGSGYACSDVQEVLYQLDTSLLREAVFNESPEETITHTYVECHEGLRTTYELLEVLQQAGALDPMRIPAALVGQADIVQRETSLGNQRIYHRRRRYYDPDRVKFDEKHKIGKSWAIGDPVLLDWFRRMNGATNSLRSRAFSVFWGLENATEFKKRRFREKLDGDVASVQEAIRKVELLLQENYVRRQGLYLDGAGLST